MLPIGPLMIEHRLIERMIVLLAGELEDINKNAMVDVLFIDEVIDFFKVYADRCHHGKEEDILFSSLFKKKLSREHKEAVDSLIAGHVFGRKLIEELARAKEAYAKGENSALANIKNVISELSSFYPAHIDTEDKHFFLPVMGYFSDKEKDDMLAEFREFDSKLIHERYDKILSGLEAQALSKR